MELSAEVKEELEKLQKEEKIFLAKQEAKKIFYKGRYEALPFTEKKVIYLQFSEIFLLNDCERFTYDDKRYFLSYNRDVIMSNLKNYIKEGRDSFKVLNGPVKSIKRFFECLIIGLSRWHRMDNYLNIYREKYELLQKFYKKYPFMEIYDIEDIVSEYNRAETEYIETKK